MPNRQLTSEKTFDFLSDEELLLQFHDEQNHKSFEILYNRYAHLIYGTCINFLKEKETAKDAMMSVIEQLIITKPPENLHSFSSWIYNLTKNKCLDVLKAKGTYTENLKNMPFEEKYLPNFMESRFGNRLNREKIDNAISQLKESQASCIRLFYFDNLCYEDIAAATGFNTKQVKSHLQNGKRQLSKLISKI